MSEKAKRPSYGLSNEQFAELWNKCESVKEVSDASRMPMPSCQTKAAILRKKGLTLKLFKRGRRVATPATPLNQVPVEHHDEVLTNSQTSAPSSVSVPDGGANAA